MNFRPSKPRETPLVPRQQTKAEVIGLREPLLTAAQRSGAQVQAALAAQAFEERAAATEARLKAEADAKKAYEDALWDRIQRRGRVR
jgi:hypothetical protein